MNPPLIFRTLNRITTNPFTTDTTRIRLQNTTFSPNNSCISFVLSTFILRPFPFTAFFYCPYLSITSANDSSYKTRSSAHNNFKNGPKALERHQPSQKMNLILPRQQRQQFYNLYKET